MENRLSMMICERNGREREKEKAKRKLWQMEKKAWQTSSPFEKAQIHGGKCSVFALNSSNKYFSPFSFCFF